MRLLPIILVILGACRSGTSRGAEPAPENLPLPTGGLLGEQAAVYPLTLIAASAETGWEDLVRPRDRALRAADSIIALALTERSPEIDWVLPERLRVAANRAPGLLSDPDRLGTSVLRSPAMDRLPDPLFSQMRNLNGVAGGRMALVPASLLYVPSPDGRYAFPQAELTLVLADVRTGLIRWRTRLLGTGEDPWQALWNALKKLNPDLP